MNWPTGTLTATCIRGRGCTFYGISFTQAQQILDEQYGQNLKEAMYHPNAVAMQSADFRDWDATPVPAIAP